MPQYCAGCGDEIPTIVIGELDSPYWPLCEDCFFGDDPDDIGQPDDFDYDNDTPLADDDGLEDDFDIGGRG